jgi:hypothetical protein
MRSEENLRRGAGANRGQSRLDNLDKLAFGVGVLAHVLLLSPESAYQHIYSAFSLRPK